MKKENIILSILVFLLVFWTWIAVVKFPTKVWTEEHTKHYATVHIATTPAQTFDIGSVYDISVYSRWGHNNVRCSGPEISSTAPIVITNERSVTTNDQMCNLLWTRIWFIVVIIGAFIVSSFIIIIPSAKI